MSTSPTSLNLPAAALTVLQARNTAALTPAKSATDGGHKGGQLLTDTGDNLAQPSPHGGPIPRGQILNILV